MSLSMCEVEYSHTINSTSEATQNSLLQFSINAAFSYHVRLEIFKTIMPHKRHTEADTSTEQCV